MKFNHEEELRNVNQWKNPLPLCIYADRSDFKQDEMCDNKQRTTTINQICLNECNRSTQ